MDYNLAFAGFQSGSASAAVNFPIDTPVSGIDLSERPIINKLLEVDEYKEKYHNYLQEILDGYFNNGKFDKKVDELNSLIGEYVKNDATAFFSYDKYTAGIDMLKEFGKLRAKSIQGQLDGSIPSTTQGQSKAADKLIDASAINLSVMGSQGGGMGRNAANKSQGVQQLGDNQMPQEEWSHPKEINSRVINKCRREGWSHPKEINNWAIIKCHSGEWSHLKENNKQAIGECHRENGAVPRKPTRGR